MVIDKFDQISISNQTHLLNAIPYNRNGSHIKYAFLKFPRSATCITATELITAKHTYKTGYNKFFFK